jgi:eukaryotic-like serine/threonine-protein kinase
MHRGGFMIGEKLGSFRIEAVLGTGAMGVVYRGMNEATGKPAAVKVISGEIAKQGKAYERFRREAEILQQFRHSNIVRFLALGRFQGTSYFAMEYISGENLDQLLSHRGPLPWREVVDMGIQICDALHYAHEHGVVHRDLKPSNLMVSDGGQIKLTDFGIAKDLDATALTAPGRTLGTAAYMAPEQIRGTPEVSHKTDLYALGNVFYQMLTGQTAFSGASAVVLMHSHLNQPPPRASAKVPDIPKALDDLVVKLMAKAPADRPWDAAAAGLTLSELRDKAAKGEKVAMVWPAEGDKAANPTRAGLEAPRKTKTKSTVKTSGRFVLSRTMIETALLVLGLLVVGGGIAYVLWPPGEAYLYRHAKELMASPHRHDWVTARNTYLDPLDRRFPRNPYGAEIHEWRDRIVLDEAEGRSKLLDSPVETPLSVPTTDGERLYQSFSHLVRKDLEAGDDPTAAAHWMELSNSINKDDPKDGRWHLLALKRANDLKAAIGARRAFVEAQLQRIAQSQREGRFNDAVTLRDDLNQRYGKYRDLADLLAPADVPSPTPGPEPAPATPVPGSPTVPSAAGAAVP